MTAQMLARIETEEPAPRLAVLIDADNAQSSVIEGVLAEAAHLGEPIVKRMYGDFTSASLSPWKHVLHKHAIKPMQQFAYTTGKNATDSALIIDAMDLFYTQNFDVFCLVTSDSDFTGLATRLKEGGKKVYGFGKRQTPLAFRNACHQFIFTDALTHNAAQAKPAAPKPKAVPAPAKAAAAAKPPQRFPTRSALDALEQSMDEDGWAHLGQFGGALRKFQPDFAPRMHGHKKLSELIKATDVFVTQERVTPGKAMKNLYFRLR